MNKLYAKVSYIGNHIAKCVQNPFVNAKNIIQRNRYRRQRTVNKNNVVFITGCDSGLGFNMALQCYKLNMFVVAACLNTNSTNKLQEYCGSNQEQRLKIVQLDLTDNNSIDSSVKLLTTLLKSNEQLELTALINNAGVMCFGEFEWQTNNLIESQINVNLIGTMKITKALLPLIRQYKSRVITITSHCAIEAMPTLAPYGASKAGLSSWLNALRVEQLQYGVQIINFIPGSFFMSSNLISNQQQYYKQMKSSFTAEQLKFYSEYFERLNNFLKLFSINKDPVVINDAGLLETFHKTILDVPPKAIYKHEPWRYTFYHFLFKISPIFIRDKLMIKFASLPRFQK